LKSNSTIDMKKHYYYPELPIPQGKRANIQR